MWFWALVAIGVAIAYWRVTIALAVLGAIGFGLFKLGQKFWEEWDDELVAQGAREDPLKELWGRFSDKPVVAQIYRPVNLGKIHIALALLPFALLGIGNEVTQGALQRLLRSMSGGAVLVLYAATYALLVWGAYRLALRFYKSEDPDIARVRSYDELLAYVDGGADAQEVLKRCPSLREAAKARLWGPRAFHRTVAGGKAYEDHPKYYDSDRLANLLGVLERHFPLTDPDERFRQRYWNYAQPIWRLLRLREDARADGSLFGKEFPENPEVVARAAQMKEEERREERKKRLTEERARMAEGSARRKGSVMTRKEALAVLALPELPEPAVLQKFEAAMMASAPEEKQAELALAFRVLRAAGREQNEEKEAG